MYKEHFGLRELPFSIAPDPRFLYLSDQHREALAHLIYGTNSEGGFVLLTGEVGTGKTTVCRCLLEQLPEQTDIAFIYNPKLTVEELLASICDELRISYPEGTKSIKVFIDTINSYLLENFSKGRKTVIILEEAQNLSPEVLEEIRLLTNLETNRQKLLQVIMVGQPELRDMLLKPELRQLSQRITARYHLEPLKKNEVGPYVNYRLETAGANSILFPESLMDHIYRFSKGIPRLINLICDRSLLGAYVQGKDCVDKKTLLKAVKEIFGEHDIRIRDRKALKWAALILLLIVCGAGLAAVYYNRAPKLINTRQAVASKPKEAAPAIVQFDSIEWPSTLPVERSKSMAYDALLKEWGLTSQNKSSGTACEQVVAKGLRCLEGKMSFDKLIRLNRPAVIKLGDENGRAYYAALKTINGDSAQCIVGGEPRNVDLREIKKRRQGDYLILWRIPPDYKGILYPGDRRPVVAWLENKLAEIQGRKPLDTKNPVYNEILVNQIKKFQQDEGIPSFGFVGPRTIIHLNNKAGSDEPKLMKKGEA